MNPKRIKTKPTQHILIDYAFNDNLINAYLKGFYDGKRAAKNKNKRV